MREVHLYVFINSCFYFSDYLRQEIVMPQMKETIANTESSATETETLESEKFRRV